MDHKWALTFISVIFLTRLYNYVKIVVSNSQRAWIFQSFIRLSIACRKKRRKIVTYKQRVSERESERDQTVLLKS